MYEQRPHHLLTRAEFARRVLRHLLLALGIGIAGYHFLAGLGWLDAMLNASMILSGMGPVYSLETPAAKLFASFYALFSGLVFVGIASVIVAPFVHRLLHRLHIDER